MDYVFNGLSILLLIVGFGFVIFWHELGHFLAAKWVGVRVEQFAVGMGHAIVSFRKGIGWKWGSTKSQYERLVTEHLRKQRGDQVQFQEKVGFTQDEMLKAADELGLGETEYRLSWIPVGGYVKMLGQDDLDPTSRSDDPRAYNKKTVGQRMLVISAGVIMNIILAGILFTALFLHGFKAPAPVVGNLEPGSPAQIARIRAGDRIVAFGEQPQHDFTKISLNTALASPMEPLQVKVRRYDTGAEEVLSIQPTKPEGSAKSFLAMGFSPAPFLGGMKERDLPKPEERPDLNLALKAGDRVTAVNGHATVAADARDVVNGAKDWALLDRELQASKGNPVNLTVKRSDGKIDTIQITGNFAHPFGPNAAFNIAGMKPRITILYMARKDAPVSGKLMPGDVVRNVTVHAANAPPNDPGTPISNPSRERFMELTADAGAKEQTIDFAVIRDGRVVEIKGIKPTLDVGKDAKGVRRKGIGVMPWYDDGEPVVAELLADSPAAKAGLSPGARIVAVAGKPVRTWYDVIDGLIAGGPGQIRLTVADANASKPAEKTIALGEEQVTALRNIRVTTNLAMAELTEVRKTGNPLQALGWGVTETRDLILQFYVTLKRVFYEQTVSASNFMGPVGIFGAGAKFAFKGTDWLIWFLAMISANLAVVNFLPIPIVDGGHFIFLIIEKIQGKPPSRRVLETAQLVGLFFIIGVFLLVTYNDISRMFGH
jgi:regulator of sigma E protease